jgi:hypothetical protein
MRQLCWTAYGLQEQIAAARNLKVLHIGSPLERLAPFAS